MNKLRLVYAVLAFAALAACQEEGPEKIVDDPLDGSGQIVSTGEFVDLNTGHKISGQVLLVIDAQGKKSVRFENFSVVNGPDVNVYLSKSASYKDVIDLGDLKGTMGNMNYAVADDVNTDEYKYVLVWCVKYAVLFGYAEQKSK